MLGKSKSRKAGKIQYCSDLHLEFSNRKSLGITVTPEMRDWEKWKTKLE